MGRIENEHLMRRSRLRIIPENCPTDVDTLHTVWPSVTLRLLYLLNVTQRESRSGSGRCGCEDKNGSLLREGAVRERLLPLGLPAGYLPMSRLQNSQL